MRPEPSDTGPLALIRARTRSLTKQTQLYQPTLSHRDIDAPVTALTLIYVAQQSGALRKTCEKVERKDRMHRERPRDAIDCAAWALYVFLTGDCARHRGVSKASITVAIVGTFVELM